MSSSSVFQDIVLKYDGKEYPIPANRVMGAIFRLEQIITINELSSVISSGNVPLAKVARAYAEVLRYAGAPVGDEQVYAAMFGKDQVDAILAIRTLMAMMIPPSDLMKKLSDGGTTKPGKSVASSKKRGKPQ